MAGIVKTGVTYPIGEAMNRAAHQALVNAPDAVQGEDLTLQIHDNGNWIDLHDFNQRLAITLNCSKPVCILVPIEEYQALIDRVRELEKTIAEIAE